MEQKPLSPLWRQDLSSMGHRNRVARVNADGYAAFRGITVSIGGSSPRASLIKRRHYPLTRLARRDPFPPARQNGTLHTGQQETERYAVICRGRQCAKEKDEANVTDREGIAPFTVNPNRGNGRTGTLYS
jgi:hypothetical protein